MAIRVNESKRKGKSKSTRTRTRTRTRTIKREDRLSSLPNEILIEILSRLPLRLAMATGCLSWRWRSLWTNVTSIHINSSKFNYSRDLDTSFNDIITRITSPFIHSFSLELGDARHMPQSINDPAFNLDFSWLRQICDRNVRQLNVTNTCYCTPGTYHSTTHKYMVESMFTLPSYICVTQSLVSIDQINLPNLKKLHLYSTTMNFESLEKLIKACPSLEELCFVYKFCINPSKPRRGRYEVARRCEIKFSNQNLRRLFIEELPYDYSVVINAPKFEYLAIHASKSVAFRFDEEPVMSCEAKIHLTDYTNYDCALTEDAIKCMTKFYGAFSNVTILEPDVFILENSWPSNMFCNATQLILSMSNISILLAILELCPVLDVLTLQIWDTDGLERAVEMPGEVSTWQRVLKKIKMEINCDIIKGKTTKFLVELVEYLLSKSVDLKQFHIKVREDTTVARIREMKLCKLLYQCPVLSAGCAVEFLGRFYKMSRKAGLKILITNGKDDIPIN